MWTFEIIIMLCMIAANSVFAGYELALTAASLARLRVLVREGRRGAPAALRMKESMEGSLAAVQLGITLVGAIAAATGGAGAEESFAPWLQAQWGWSADVAEIAAIALVVLPLTVVTIIFGELVPKVFALRHHEWLCLKLSPVMLGFAMFARPAVWFLETVVTGITRWGERHWRPLPTDTAAGDPVELRELRAVAGLARSARLISGREESIILNALTLSSRPLSAVMLPVTHLSMLHVEDTLTECLIAAHLDMHTRFPVTAERGNPQSILGYINFKDIVATLRMAPREASVRGILRPLPALPVGGSLASGLEQMMREHTHIALVRNVAGRVVGLVTLEDILEVLVGEIEDEYDRLPAHLVRAGPGWIVGGGTPIAQVAEKTGRPLATTTDAPPALTFAQWVERGLGRPVHPGEILELAGVRIVVRKVRRTQILEAQLGLPPPPAPPPAGPTDAPPAEPVTPPPSSSSAT